MINYKLEQLKYALKQVFWKNIQVLKLIHILKIKHYKSWLTINWNN